MKGMNLVELTKEEERELRGGERIPVPTVEICVCYCFDSGLDYTLAGLEFVYG